LAKVTLIQRFIKRRINTKSPIRVIKCYLFALAVGRKLRQRWRSEKAERLKSVIKKQQDLLGSY